MTSRLNVDYFRNEVQVSEILIVFYRYMYGGEVSSLRIPDDDIVTHGKCLSINDQVGRHLRDENKIRYKLKLMKAS